MHLLYLIYKGRQSRFWIIKKATILELSIKRSLNSKYGFRYEPKIEYKYIADGVLYISKRFSYNGMNFKKKDIALEKIKNIEVGKSIYVYINIKNPKQSVVERGVEIRTYLGLVLLTIFIVYMFIVFYST